MRALWTGRLQFGSFDFPIKIYSATQSNNVSLNLLHTPCHSQIRYEKRCPVHGPVLEGEISKAYEYEKGKFVEITEQELESLAPRTGRSLEVQLFVEPSALEPLLFDKPYYMVPEGPLALEAYNSLRESIRSSGKYGIGKMVMRRKEMLVALWAKDNAIVVSSLRYDNEVMSPAMLDELNGGRRKSKKGVTLATGLIDRHTKKFRYKRFKDGYQKKLLALVKEKVARMQREERRAGRAVPASSKRAKRGMEKAPPVRRPRRKTGTAG